VKKETFNQSKTKIKLKEEEAYLSLQGRSEETSKMETMSKTTDPAILIIGNEKQTRPRIFGKMKT